MDAPPLREDLTAIAAGRLARARPAAGVLYWPLRYAVRALAGLVLFGHLHVTGARDVPRSGGLLVISNHISTADPPLLGTLFPRPLHFMAKAEWFRSGLLAFLAREFLCFPVVRHTPDRAALRHTLDLLASGQAVALYPEGTRSDDARVRRPEAGAGFIARHSGVPIVPVATWGAEDAWPRGARLPRPKHTHLRIGPAFQLPDSPMSNQEAADYLMSRVAELLPERYRGYFEER